MGSSSSPSCNRKHAIVQIESFLIESITIRYVYCLFWIRDNRCVLRNILDSFIPYTMVRDAPFDSQVGGRKFLEKKITPEGSEKKKFTPKGWAKKKNSPLDGERKNITIQVARFLKKW